MAALDAIVIGLGAMGSAALYQLARRRAKAVGIDRFIPPHAHGSSHGETRITRQAVGEGDAYVPIVLRSHEIWREIETDTGEVLLDQCGVLILSGPHANHPHKAAFFDETLAVARRHGIPHEILSAGEVRDRFPQFVLSGDERGYFEPGAGFVHPERCIAAQLRLAARAGATIRTGETVTAIVPSASGVRVETDRGAYEAASAIVAAGAWTPGLIGAPLGHMAIYRQVLTWFEPERPAEYAPDRFPAFIWIHGGEGDQSYGFPILPDSAGLKIASEIYEVALDSPEAVNREVAEDEIERVYRRHVAGRFGGVTSRCVNAQVCLYTLAPDNRFAIDTLSESDRVLVVSACSGHGFKHSAALGEAAAERILEGRSRLDLSGFNFPARAQGT